jgi:hypothetical protein
VSINWLLKSKDKHAPESVEEYLITPSEGKKVIKPERKKRARGVSPADEDSGSLKKKKEQHLPLQYLIDLVDEGYPEPSQ